MTFVEDGTPDERDFVLLHPTSALAVDCREGIWHTFFALEPDTVIFEAKAGPHNAADAKEWAPWAPEENSAEAENYLAGLKELFKKRLRL
jgi:cupin fold WbuC family metalloprotein